jgi:hypothetical protein
MEDSLSPSRGARHPPPKKPQDAASDALFLRPFMLKLFDRKDLCVNFLNARYHIPGGWNGCISHAPFIRPESTKIVQLFYGSALKTHWSTKVL